MSKARTQQIGGAMAAILRRYGIELPPVVDSHEWYERGTELLDEWYQDHLSGETDQAVNNLRTLKPLFKNTECNRLVLADWLFNLDLSDIEDKLSKAAEREAASEFIAICMIELLEFPKNELESLTLQTTVTLDRYAGWYLDRYDHFGVRLPSWILASKLAVSLKDGAEVSRFLAGLNFWLKSDMAKKKPAHLRNFKNAVERLRDALRGPADVQPELF